MAQQTAVEYMIEKILLGENFLQVCIMAKTLEKEQIVGAYLEGDRNGFTRYKSADVEQRTSEQYYKETYNT